MQSSGWGLAFSRCFFPKETKAGETVPAPSLVTSKVPLARGDSPSKARNILQETDHSAIHMPVLPRRTAKPGSSVLDFRPQLPVPPGGMGPLGQGNILAAAFQPAPELPALKYGLRKMEGPPAS